MSLFHSTSQINDLESGNEKERKGKESLDRFTVGLDRRNRREMKQKGQSNHLFV